MIKIGTPSYLNTKIISYPIERKKVVLQSSMLIEDVPSRLGTMLENGEIDLGLVSTGIMTEDLIIAPTISISGPGKVESVILFSNRKLQDESEWNLGLSKDSYTANMLAMMLCKERYSNGARFVLDGRTDAQVMIGDNALRQLREKGHWKYVIDLAKEWYDWTRLPMVFAVLVSKRKSASIIKAARGIVRAKEWGLKHIPEIARASKPDFMSIKETERYIRNIDYSLGEKHIESIIRFMTVMQKHGYTDRVFSGRRLW